MIEARETALMMAANINAGKNLDAEQLIRDAQKIERYLNGSDGAEPPDGAMCAGPAETKGDPDFAEVDMADAQQAMPRTRRQAMAETRSVINDLMARIIEMPITPNDVTRARHILLDMLQKYGIIILRSREADDIVRTILRNYLDGKVE